MTTAETREGRPSGTPESHVVTLCVGSGARGPERAEERAPGMNDERSGD